MPTFADDGFCVVANVLTGELRERLAAAFDEVVAHRAGVRGGLALPVVQALAGSRVMRALVEPILGREAFVFRATLFDKTPAANWLVAWHQDLVVPVAARTDEPGFGPWSSKAGVVYVQPPVEVLEQLLAVRVDLDGSGAGTGGLRVLPGTHRDGVLSRAAVAERCARIAAVAPEVAAGAALGMRPLLVHASSRAVAPQHRRIVHLEFAPRELPGRVQFRCAGVEANVS